jgi:hypothetical protein
MRRIAILAAAAASLISPSAHAQAGGSSVPLLELPASTRALALGNAFVAAGKDEASIFYNPAQLATVEKLSAGLSVQQWFLGQTVAAAAAAVRDRSPGARLRQLGARVRRSRRWLRRTYRIGNLGR